MIARETALDAAQDPARPGSASVSRGRSAAASGRRLLGQILKARGVVREGQVQEALALQRKQGGLIGQCLIEGAACTSSRRRARARRAGRARDRRPRRACEPTPERSPWSTRPTAHAFGVLPLRVDGETLVVALADPLNTAVLEDLRFIDRRRGARRDRRRCAHRASSSRSTTARRPRSRDAIAEAARSATGRRRRSRPRRARRSCGS